MKSKKIFFRTTVLILSFIALQFSLVFSQESFSCFISTEDYANRSAYENTVKPKIKMAGSSFIKAPKMINESNRKDKLASTSWAIRYNDENYVNMRYSYEYQNLELYVKPHVEGKFTVIIIDSKTHRVITSGGQNYSGGVQGLLIKESAKWGKSWIDENGEKCKIIIFDTSKPERTHIKGHVNSLGKMLSKNNFNKILSTSLPEDQIKSMTFNEVMKIIAEENKSASSKSE